MDTGKKAGREAVLLVLTSVNVFYVLIGTFFFSGVLRWKENLAQKAAAAFLQRQQDTPNLQKLVYGNGETYSG